MKSNQQTIAIAAVAVTPSSLRNGINVYMENGGQLEFEMKFHYQSLAFFVLFFLLLCVLLWVSLCLYFWSLFRCLLVVFLLILCVSLQQFVFASIWCRTDAWVFHAGIGYPNRLTHFVTKFFSSGGFFFSNGFSAIFSLVSFNTHVDVNRYFGYFVYIHMPTNWYHLHYYSAQVSTTLEANKWVCNV